MNFYDLRDNIMDSLLFTSDVKEITSVVSITAFWTIKTMQLGVTSDGYIRETFFIGLLFSCLINRLSGPSVW
jgi:hypothetical protein